MLENFLNKRIHVKVGDITKENSDAIVNAANWTLLGGGGVDGAIHRVGGKDILTECETIRKTTHPGGLPTGDAVITTAGNLPSRYVIHTVGPIYGRENGKESDLLANSYRNSLELAVKEGLKTISFPSISTGAFRYPKHEAAQISSRAIQSFLSKNKTIEQISLVFFSETDVDKFLRHHSF